MTGFEVSLDKRGRLDVFPHRRAGYAHHLENTPRVFVRVGLPTSCQVLVFFP